MSPLTPAGDGAIPRVHVRLQGPEYGPFDGAIVEAPSSDEQRLLDNMKMLIKAGRIRYNPPGYVMKVPQDYFDAHDHPYIGVTVWLDGQMRIERLPVATQNE